MLDSCDVQPEGQASVLEPSLALPDDKTNGDLTSSSSIIVETRIKPNDLFQTTHTKQPATNPEDIPQNDDNHDSTQSPQADPQIITEKETDIADILAGNNNDDKLNFGETLPENLTSTPINDSSDVIFSTQTRDKLLQPQNNPDPLEIMSMMFPAGRLPLEPQFPHLRRPIPIHRPNMNKHMFMRPPNPNYNKKYYYRAPVRRGPVVRPISHAHPNNNIQHSFTLAQEPVLLLPPPKGYLNISSTTPISPPEATTTNTPRFRPAINTGFHPESVVIESGFRPIVTKEFEKRVSEDEEEPEDDVGVIQTLPENVQSSQSLTQTFEPMFIPSPLDNSVNKKNHSSKISKRRFQIPKKSPPNMIVIVKEGRSNNQDEVLSDDGDPMVMAAERIQSYYLPPDGRKTKPVGKARKATSIDIPPGQVITYDGKTVSGTSLAAPVSAPNRFAERSSQANRLRLSPQFGPFRGEKPPLNPSNVKIASIPQLGRHASINRDLSAPDSALEKTRLSAVRYRRETGGNELQQTQDLDDVRGARIERSPHHTLQHTAQQKRNSTKQSPGKKFVYQEEVTRRTKRSPHHTAEHTAEQNRNSRKLPLGTKFAEVQSLTTKVRIVRSAHHTPQHTSEQKRDSTKTAAGKKFIRTEEQEKHVRVIRNAHHTPEHTHEQKRVSAKQPSKKFTFQEHKRTERIARSAHHTPEHTAEQKRVVVKKWSSKKFIQLHDVNIKHVRTARSPHHTPEHTAKQKKDGIQISANKQPAQSTKVKRSPHHTAEHTAQQKKDGINIPENKNPVNPTKPK